MSTARQERRIAERDRLRERMGAERLAERDRPRQRERELALVQGLAGIACPEPVADFVILLAEDMPPIAAKWSCLPDALRRAAGIELHEDVIALVERIRARGEIACITYVEGWTHAYSAKVTILSPGGST